MPLTSEQMCFDPMYVIFSFQHAHSSLHLFHALSQVKFDRLLFHHAMYVLFNYGSDFDGKIVSYLVSSYLSLSYIILSSLIFSHDTQLVIVLRPLDTSFTSNRCNIHPSL